jgi:hypothetical protein
MSTLAAAAGAYVHLFTNVLSGNFLTAFAAIGFLLTLFATPDESGKNATTRISLLLGFAFCSGMFVSFTILKQNIHYLTEFQVLVWAPFWKGSLSSTLQSSQQHSLEPQ